MRTMIFTLIGFVAGALAGIMAAFLAVLLWYDVLGIGDHGDGLSGFASFMALSLLLGLGGGVIGAVLIGRRANGGQGTPARLPVAIGLAFILGLVALFLLGVI